MELCSVLGISAMLDLMLLGYDLRFDDAVCSRAA